MGFTDIKKFLGQKGRTPKKIVFAELDEDEAIIRYYNFFMNKKQK